MRTLWEIVFLTAALLIALCTGCDSNSTTPLGGESGTGGAQGGMMMTPSSGAGTVAKPGGMIVSGGHVAGHPASQGGESGGTSVTGGEPGGERAGGTAAGGSITGGAVGGMSVEPVGGMSGGNAAGAVAGGSVNGGDIAGAMTGGAVGGMAANGGNMDVGGVMRAGGAPSVGGMNMLRDCAEDECPAERPQLDQCPNGQLQELRCKADGDEGECRWFIIGCDIEICDGADVDDDNICDERDTQCNADGSALECDQDEPICAEEMTVPEIKEGCFTGRCVTWAECGQPPECDENTLCGEADRPNCRLECVNFRCVADCVQCQLLNCGNNCAFGYRLNNDGCETCECIDPPNGCPDYEYESADPDGCAALDCPIDQELFSAPGCGCGCKLRPCPEDGEDVCGINGEVYANDCLLGRAGIQEADDWQPCCDDLACAIACPFGTKKDQRGCDICECNPAPNGCPSADAAGVSYESNDPAVCAVQNFVCPAGSVKFDNERCGCGCQPASVDICPIERSAVCGADGQTYRNGAMRRRLGSRYRRLGSVPI